MWRGLGVESRHESGVHDPGTDRGCGAPGRAARPARGHRRPARGRDHQPQLPGATSAAPTTWCGCPASAPRCSASTARRSASRTRPRPSSASRQRWPRCSTEPSCLVTAFVSGREMKAEELREPETIAEVAHDLRSLHDSGTELPTDFDSFRLVEEYAETGRANGSEPPDGYDEALEAAHAIEGAVRDQPGHEPVPAHNDLLPANFLRDGDRMQLIDWEYAGMGDRWFDLGNFAVNNELDDDQEDAAARGLLRRAARRPAPRDAEAVPLHVGLPRGDVGRRCRRACPSSTSTSASTRGSTSTASRRRAATRASRAGSRKPAASGRAAGAPRRSALRDRRRGRRRHVDRLPPGRAGLGRRGAGGPQPAHVGLHLPLRRPRRASCAAR